MNIFHEDLNDYPVYDPTAIAKTVGLGVDTQFEVTMLEVFLKAAYNRYAMLCDAVASGNQHMTLSHAHNLKGSACHVGARRIFHLCCLIEEQAEKADKDFDSDILEFLQEEMSQFETVVSRKLKRVGR